VIGAAFAGAGWLAAGLAFLFGLTMRRSQAARMEAVARACHELRGPITAARLGLQLGARNAELSAARLRAIDLELGRAALALDDLGGGPERTPRAPMDGECEVGELLADAVEASRASASHHDVEIELTWTGGRSLVCGNRLRLGQAVRNLIANAVEHGGGMVEVRGRSDGSAVRIEVTDGGAGLPAPVPELTRRARAGRGSRGRGLAIAAAIAAAHGGRLASAPSERGARLVLELPAAVGEPRHA